MMTLYVCTMSQQVIEKFQFVKKTFDKTNDHRAESATSRSMTEMYGIAANKNCSSITR